MIPQANIVQIGEQIKTSRYPSLTFRLDFKGDRVTSSVDGVKAVEQMIYKVLLTERYRYAIYDWNYGIELEDLFGEPRAYVYPELKRRIGEAILQDDRISSVDDFEFSALARNVVGLIFTAYTIYGEFEVSGRVRV